MNPDKIEAGFTLVAAMLESTGLKDDPRLRMLRALFPQPERITECPRCGLPRERMDWHPEGDNMNLCPRCSAPLRP